MEMTRLEALQSEYSDAYKEFNGFRPRGTSPNIWYSESALEVELKALYAMQDSRMDWLKETFAGREQLREEGWYIEPETDPMLAQYSAWIAAEREREYLELYNTPFAEGEELFTSYEEYDV